MKLSDMLLGAPFDVDDQRPAPAPGGMGASWAPVTDDEWRDLIRQQVDAVQEAGSAARRSIYLGLAALAASLMFGLASSAPAIWYATLIGGHAMLYAALWLQHGRVLFPLPALAGEPLEGGSSWMSAAQRNSRRVRAQTTLRSVLSRGLSATALWFAVCALAGLSERFDGANLPGLVLVSFPGAILVLALAQYGYDRIVGATEAWVIRHSDDDALPYIAFWANALAVFMDTAEWVVTVNATVTADGRAYVTVDTRCARAALRTQVSRNDLSARLAAFCRVYNDRASGIPFADDIPWRAWGGTAAAEFSPTEDETSFGWTVVYDAVDAARVAEILVTDMEAFTAASVSRDGDGWVFRATTRGPAVSSPPALITPALLAGDGSVRLSLRLPGQWIEHKAAERSADGAVAWSLTGPAIALSARSIAER